MTGSVYERTAALMLAVGPDVLASPKFALKGGTAINFFVQDMPRFSVDFDLVFVPHDMGRADALAFINEELLRIRSRLLRRGLSVEGPPPAREEHTKLFARSGDIEVKIEINHVFRGTLLPIEERRLAPSVSKTFGVDLGLPVLAVEELYGGKLVAAMDRQHPRDLFDVQVLFDTVGINSIMVDCFVAYLAGHHRAIHDVLFPRDKDIKPAFFGEFLDMPKEPVALEALEATRVRLKQTLHASLKDYHKAFLLGLLSGNPPWEALPFPALSMMPALRWKLLNLEKFKRANPRRHQEQYDLLANALDQIPPPIKDHGPPSRLLDNTDGPEKWLTR